MTVGGTTSRWRAWLLAIRLPTLPAAIVPVLVGSALAWHDDRLRLGAATAALVGALLIQIGTNLANDVDDFERGADTAARQGPLRVTQSGLLDARAVRRACRLAFGSAAVVGLYLAALGGWPIVVLGAAAIVSGLAYTGGPWPLGYHGLGDLFVFAFFGVAAVVGTYYAQAGTTSGAVWAASIPVGALATAILVVNNVRDVATDRLAGKRTLAVRLGEGFGRAEFVALLLLAYLTPPALWARSGTTAAILLPWLSVPAAVALVRTMLAPAAPGALNHTLRATARLHLLYGLLFAIGLAT